MLFVVVFVLFIAVVCSFRTLLRGYITSDSHATLNPLGDLDGNGEINATDWSTFMAGQDADFTDADFTEVGAVEGYLLG